MPRIGICLGNFLSLDLLRDAARAAEEAGYEICWMTEGLGKDTPSQLAALAGCTSTMKLGTGILTIYTRSATLMAQVAGSLDEITGGRFVLGLGTGHGPSLQQNHGVTLERPFQRTRDYVHVVRESLAGGSLSYQGRVISVPNLKLLFPVPRRPVPIYLAALGPRMAELAGEIADGVLFNMGIPEYLAEAVGRLRSAARRAGRDPSQVDVACLVLASAGDASSERLCRERIANYLLLPFYQNLLRLSGFDADVDRVVAALKEGDTQKGSRAISDRMLDALAFSGAPATWWPKVMKLDKAGVSLVCPFLFPSGRDARESLLRGIEGLAQARRAHEGR